MPIIARFAVETTQRWGRKLDLREGYLLSLPSRRLPVECAFSPDGLFEAQFRLGNTPNCASVSSYLRFTFYALRFTLYVLRLFRLRNMPNLREGEQLRECQIWGCKTALDVTKQMCRQSPGAGGLKPGGKHAKMAPSLPGRHADDPDDAYLLSLPSRRLLVECAFSPDGLLEARFRVRNTSNLRAGAQLFRCKNGPIIHPLSRLRGLGPRHPRQTPQVHRRDGRLLANL